MELHKSGDLMHTLHRMIGICGVALATLLLSEPALARHHHHASAEKAEATKTKSTKSTARNTKAVEKTSAKTRHAKAEKAEAPARGRKSRRRVSEARAVPAKVVREVAPPRPAIVRRDAGGEEVSNIEGARAPNLSSSAFYVQDVRTGQVLLEKNSNSIVPIASITKLMTAMVVLDARLPMGDAMEISDDDVDHLKNTSSHLTVGTRLTREEFMRLALMSSENRAALALSRYYPGGRPAFIEAMNAKAKLLGMTDTRFYDPSGLNQSNVSSARDLATLVSNASHYPLIRDFTTTAEYTVELARGRPHTFHNTNALVKSPEWQIEVSKTGFINESGKCLVMQAWLANKPLAIVLLDSWGRFTRLADANRIRKWLEEVLPRNGTQKVAENTRHHADM